MIIINLKLRPHRLGAPVALSSFQNSDDGFASACCCPPSLFCRPSFPTENGIVGLDGSGVKLNPPVKTAIDLRLL